MAPSRFLPALSFHWVMRLSQPMRAVPWRIQAQLGMGGDRALREEDRLRRIDAAGDQRRGHFADVGAQLRRVDVDGQRVEVGEEEQAFRLVLHPHPAQDRAEQIAEVKVAGRLDAGNDAHRHRSAGIGLRPPAPRSRRLSSSLSVPPRIQTSGK